MKYFLRKSCFIVLSALFTVFFITGCSNFFNGKEIKTNLDNQIELAKAPEISVRISAETGTGTFPAAKDFNVKAGKEFSVEFILNESDYIFNKWIFTDIKTETVNLESSVSYTATVSENTYSLKIKLASNIESILIKPECFLIPKIKSAHPEMIEEGKPQDSSIYIVFNSPVKAEDFMDFKNISIKSGGIEIAADYFELPELSNENQLLTINTIKTKPLIENLTTTSTKDIIVSLKTGAEYSLTGDLVRPALSNKDSTADFKENFTWTYRINQSRDSEEPVINSISLYKDEEGNAELSNEVYTSSWDIEKCSQNHAKDIYVKIAGSDTGSGVSKIKVQENFKLSQTGSTVSEDSKTKSFDFKNNEPVKIDFQHVNDGLVELIFSIVDYANNESEQFKYYVIKDTQLEALCINAYPESINPSFDPAIYPDRGYYNNGYYRNSDEDGFETVTINCEASKKYFFQKNLSTLTIDVERSDDNINFSKADITKSSDTSFNLRRDAYKNTFVRITATDELGNTNSILRCIPAAISIIAPPEEVTFTKDDKTNKVLKFKPNDLESLYNLSLTTISDSYLSKYAFFYKKDGDDNALYTNGTGVLLDGAISVDGIGYTSPTFKYIEDSNQRLTSGTYYFYAVYRFYFDGDQWCGCLGKPFKITVAIDESGDYTFTYGDSAPASILPEDFTVTAGAAIKNKGTRTVHISLPESFVKNSDYSYYVKYTKNSASPAKLSDVIYSQNFDFEVESGNKYWFYITAKDTEGTSVSTTRTDKTFDASEDNIAPFILMTSSYLTSEVCEPSKIRLASLCKPQDASGLYSENGKVSFEYYLVKNDNDKDTLISRTLEELRASYTPKKAVFDSTMLAHPNYGEEKGEYLDFFFDEKDEGWYNMYIVATDASPLKNTSVLNFTINNKISGNSLNASITNSGAAVTIPYKEYIYNYIYIAAITNGTEWKKFYNDYSFSTEDLSINISSIKNHFIKVCGKEYYSPKNQYNVSYFYPLNYDNSIVCENKNLLKCERGYQVFNDEGKLMFLHTLYSRFNYGENSQDWYNKAIESNILEKSSGSFTYNPDLSEIPEGFWYTIIAHYADGDTIMTTPVQIIK